MKNINKYIDQIDYATQMTTRITNRESEDHPKYVIRKPIEFSGIMKWKVRIIKAWAILAGKADAFTYSKHQ